VSGCANNGKAPASATPGAVAPLAGTRKNNSAFASADAATADAFQNAFGVLSSVFKADSVTIAVSREKDGKLRLVYAGWDDFKVVPLGTALTG